MVEKEQVLGLIALHGPRIIKALKLGHLSIHWHVYHSEEKEMEEYGFSSKDCVAQCTWNSSCPNTRTYHIAIFYDKQDGLQDTFGSIFHELFHVRMRQWDKLVKPEKSRRARDVEEGIVLDVEAIVMELFPYI